MFKTTFKIRESRIFVKNLRRLTLSALNLTLNSLSLNRFILNNSVLCFKLVDNSGSHTNAMYRIVISLKLLEKIVTYNSSKADKLRNISRDSSFN